MEETIRVRVVGLPEDFDLTPEEARMLGIDDIVVGAPLDLGIFHPQAEVVKARIAAEGRNDERTCASLQLLIAVAGFGLSDDPRAPFGRGFAGHYADGSLWHTALPDDLTDRHACALDVMLDAISSPILRARIADVLWQRARPRNPVYAREAITAYLNVAEATFDPNHWTVSEQHFGRAFRLASTLGASSPERELVLATARAFLDRLNGNDPLFYTVRIVETILKALSDPAEVEALLARIRAIAESAASGGDFERSRTYFDVAVKLGNRLQRHDDVRALRLARAETYVAQAVSRPTEMLRTTYLRCSARSSAGRRLSRTSCSNRKPPRRGAAFVDYGDGEN